MYEVILPNNYHGERYGIQFINGVGKTDSEWLAEYLGEQGMSVTRQRAKTNEGSVENGEPNTQSKTEVYAEKGVPEDKPKAAKKT